MAGFDNEVVYGKNADFTSVDNQNVLESNGLFSDGQLWIGRTTTNAGGTHVDVNTLTPGAGISITNGPGTVTIANTGSLVDLHTARFIVGNLSNGANYSTIAAAITAAASGDTIYVQTGTYTENLTLKAGVNLCAFECDALTPNVTIIGTSTLTTAGTVTISGLRLQTNSSFLLAVTGTLASIVNLKNCYLNMTNNTGISHTSSSASSAINLLNCRGNLGTTGIAKYVSTSAGNISFQYCVFSNSGNSTTASSISTGASMMAYSNFASVFSTSSVGVILATYTNIGATALNTAGITTAGTGVSAIQFCNIGSGTASAVSIGSGTTVEILNSEFTSSNTNAITGAGTLNYSGITFGSGTSTTINVTTQLGGTIQGGRFQAPSAGFLGEQIRATLASGSAVAVSTNTAVNITSISLTAGVWDVSAVALFGGGGATGLLLEGSINTTSATRGTNGDNAVGTSAMPTASGASGVSVPSYRITLTATTTVYLVAFALFTIGALTGFGRISATRVG